MLSSTINYASKLADGKVTYPAKPWASFLLYFFQVKWMLDLLRSKLWLTCSCPFMSLSFANCWNAGTLWSGALCQADTCWILCNEVSRDLAPCLWTSLFLTFLLCQEGSGLCQHSQAHQRPGRLRKDETYCFLDLSPISPRQHFYSQSGKKPWKASLQINIWLEKVSTSPEEQEPLDFWMSV